jgi:prevent-host-death family protein
MPIIGVRELARHNRELLEKVEKEKVPYLVTRNGRPVAALVPVDPADAERYVIAAAPEFAQSRRQADAEIAMGQTRPLEDLADEMLGHADAEPEAPPQESESHGVFVHRAAMIDEMAMLFGRDVAVECEYATQARLSELSRTVHEAIAGAASQDQLEEIHALNAELFKTAMPVFFSKKVAERTEGLAEGSVEVDASEGLIGPTLARETLEQVSEYVTGVNREIIGLGKEQPESLSLASYRLTLRALGRHGPATPGGIAAVRRVRGT